MESLWSAVTGMDEGMASRLQEGVTCHSPFQTFRRKTGCVGMLPTLRLPLTACPEMSLQGRSSELLRVLSGQC